MFMKKLILIFFLLLTPFLSVFSQTDPGFGDEGSGDAGTAPPAPINKHINEGILVGILVAGYFFVQKRKEQIK